MRTLGVLPVVVVALVPASPAAAQTCTGCQVASFGPSTRYVRLPPLTQPGGNPRQGAAVDMNGDGFPDFLAAASGGIAVALADGSGGFGPGTLYPGPSN